MSFNRVEIRIIIIIIVIIIIIIIISFLGYRKQGRPGRVMFHCYSARCVYFTCIRLQCGYYFLFADL